MSRSEVRQYRYEVWPVTYLLLDHESLVQLLALRILWQARSKS